jgi:hypothetical protein
MSPLRGDNLLLGALLERLGSAQGQSLLAQLDQWLSSADGESSDESAAFDEYQTRTIDAAYDRRKHTKSGTPNPQPRKASLNAQKDQRP